jgi:hypothetical protein
MHNSFTSKTYAIFTFLFTLILTKASISAASTNDHVLFLYAGSIADAHAPLPWLTLLSTPSLVHPHQP